MKTLYKNCTLLDGTPDMSPIPGSSVLVDDDRILAVYTEKDGPKSTDGNIVDLNGAYLLPGFVNLHIHVPADGKPKKKETDNAKKVRILTSNPLTRYLVRKMCEKYVLTELLSGCTTVRAVGGVQKYDSDLRDDINSGKLDGPRMLVANMAISVPGGHMAGSLAYEALSEDHARELVRIIAKDKPDLIKLMITGGVLDAKKVGEPGVLRMPASYVKAACDEAHKLGFYVAAHVESPEGVKVALENGVDTIEHGAKMDDEMISLFKEHGAKLVTTLSPALPYALFDRSVSYCTEMAQENGKIVFEGIIDCAINALKNDIPVGLGTDTGCPFITHYDMWREINYYVKYCGVSSTYALHTATLGNAKIIGIDNETGSIEPGKSADFIVCKENPLEDLSRLRQLELVVFRGKAYEHPKIKKMQKVENELDKWL
ncbi:MAG: amidohydrolase family protein [Oscillospiraceae bacterium]|nr:amidohydrolase family protein [Oscillospiraceae bacterium]